MDFEVIGPDGRGKMHTSCESCIPYESLDSMVKWGYKFKLDGKMISKSALIARRDKMNKKDNDVVTLEDVHIHGILCVETGRIYDKQASAAKDLGIDPAQVSDSIKTGRTRSGYTFRKV